MSAIYIVLSASQSLIYWSSQWGEKDSVALPILQVEKRICSVIK